MESVRFRNGMYFLLVKYVDQTAKFQHVRAPLVEHLHVSGNTFQVFVCERVALLEWHRTNQSSKGGLRAKSGSKTHTLDPREQKSEPFSWGGGLPLS